MSVTIELGQGAVEPSAPRALLPLSLLDGGVSPYVLSPDGRRILVSEPEKAARPLKVIANWPALLEKP